MPFLYSFNTSLIFEAWSLNDEMAAEVMQRPSESFFLKAVFYVVTFINFLTWLLLSMAVAVWPCMLCLGCVLIKHDPWYVRVAEADRVAIEQAMREIDMAAENQNNGGNMTSQIREQRRHNFLDTMKDHARGMMVASDQTCCICFEDYNDSDEVVTLPCASSHIFHYDCLDSWIN